MSERDPWEMAQDDIETVRRGMQGGVDTSVPAIAEGVLGALTALAVLAWLVSMWWVPEVIDGQLWLGGGLLGLTALGVPTLGIYVLRRGGVRVLERLLRGVLG